MFIDTFIILCPNFIFYQCVPLPGFGFKRGGYQCVCQPGHRLPYEQNGPFRGVDIEAATEEEYRNNFDCIPVGWREVIPEETGMKNNLERFRRSIGEQTSTQINELNQYISICIDIIIKIKFISLTNLTKCKREFATFLRFKNSYNFHLMLWCMLPLWTDINSM